eukprot:258472_1
MAKLDGLQDLQNLLPGGQFAAVQSQCLSVCDMLARTFAQVVSALDSHEKAIAKTNVSVLKNSQAIKRVSKLESQAATLEKKLAAAVSRIDDNKSAIAKTERALRADIEKTDHRAKKLSDSVGSDLVSKNDKLVKRIESNAKRVGMLEKDLPILREETFTKLEAHSDVMVDIKDDLKLSFQDCTDQLDSVRADLSKTDQNLAKTDKSLDLLGKTVKTLSESHENLQTQVDVSGSDTKDSLVQVRTYVDELVQHTRDEIEKPLVTKQRLASSVDKLDSVINVHHSEFLDLARLVGEHRTSTVSMDKVRKSEITDGKMRSDSVTLRIKELETVLNSKLDTSFISKLVLQEVFENRLEKLSAAQGGVRENCAAQRESLEEQLGQVRASAREATLDHKMHYSHVVAEMNRVHERLEAFTTRADVAHLIGMAESQDIHDRQKISHMNVKKSITQIEKQFKTGQEKSVPQGTAGGYMISSKSKHPGGGQAKLSRIGKLSISGGESESLLESASEDYLPGKLPKIHPSSN